ncbi:UbiA family prenyltransferase [Nocardioides terrisoli]|uniref:UbiA family prenyltransferase n=1 Tax=Nocardioides terrisoli TaxID=3388267 RepID=UPI00287BC307|nr:UbiA family prenyltransferase [Nocardioides marmorisolisilvae]
MSTVAATVSGPSRTHAQWRLLLGAAHPRQAVVLALAIGVLAFYSDRGWVQSLVAAAAVLVVQLAAGLLNDLFDAPLDRHGEVADKPVASGAVPRGNVTFTIAVLVLIAIPLSLQNGTLAGAALLATLVVAFVHDRILHRTPFSFVGWMLTFALYPVFLAYGGWAGGRHGDDPTWQFILVSAFVGLCVHFATTLPDLVGDNRSGVRNLPLVIALRVGAPRLLVATVVVSALVLAAFIVIGIDPGLRQW